jgi:SAM-dependent methyltransferase
MTESDTTKTYLTDMGRAVDPPSRADIRLVQRVLEHDLKGWMVSAVRGPAVDIGCGRGELVGALSNLGFSPVEGCDVGTEQVHAAQAAGLAVENADGLEFLRRRTGLTWVSAFDVLEHIPVGDLPRLLVAIHDSLRSRGVFVARFPNPSSPFFGAIQFGDPTHCNVVGPAALAVLLKRAGLTTAVVLPTRPMPHGIRSATRAAVWRIAEGLMYVARLAETGTLGGPLTQNCILIARKP